MPVTQAGVVVPASLSMVSIYNFGDKPVYFDYVTRSAAAGMVDLKSAVAGGFAGALRSKSAITFRRGSPRSSGYVLVVTADGDSTVVDIVMGKSIS